MALSIQKPLTGEYALCYDADPAFDRSAGDEEYAKKFATCQQRLDYAEITLAGATPTLFVFRPIKALEVARLMEYAAGSDSELGILSFRLALIRVENPDIKIERQNDPDVPRLGQLVSRAQTDMFGVVGLQVGRIALDLPIRLGMSAYIRSAHPLPP